MGGPTSGGVHRYEWIVCRRVTRTLPMSRSSSPWRGSRRRHSPRYTGATQVPCSPSPASCCSKGRRQRRSCKRCSCDCGMTPHASIPGAGTCAASSSWRRTDDRWICCGRTHHDGSARNGTPSSRRIAATTSSTRWLDLVTSDQVRRAVAELPDGEREAIQVAYFGGYTYREVAVRLGVRRRAR